MKEVGSPAASDPIRVLVADDEPALRRSVVRMLAARGMEVTPAEDGARALALLATGPFDVALVDLMMPRVGGLEVLENIKLHYPDIEVVLMTAFGDVETAVRAVQAGAYNFLTKPFRSNDEVGLIIAQAAERRSLKARAELLERRLSAEDTFGGMIGSSPIMKNVYGKAMGVASTKATVLILGESGTGKELTARAIHEHSPRKTKPFVAVNCSAIPENLVESELFGHVRGAFTNATAPRPGLFEAANGGTIFLDEVGDLPPQAQVKLLRVLQEGEVKRVGSNDTRLVDVRVVAATHVDLGKKIETGAFREDLFYRLNVVVINLPALRERREDIPGLAYHFLKKHSARIGREVRKIAPEAMELLLSQPWPGNVRELENAIERAIVYCKEEVFAEHLGLVPARQVSSEPPSLGSGVSNSPPSSGLSRAPASVGGNGNGAAEHSDGFNALPDALPDLCYREAKDQALAIFERFYFSKLRERTAGNVSEAARQAGLDRSNFRRAVRRAGLKWRDEEEENSKSPR